jgi:hypothetical protein
MFERRIAWGDLVSPRAMWSFTLGDAGGAIPTLLAMGGLFLTCLIVLYIVKKLVLFMLNSCRKPYTLHKFILKKQERVAGAKVVKKTWERTDNTVHRFFNYMHLIVESIFFIGIIVSVLFAAAVGNVNVWESPVAISVIGIAVTYIFASGLQQVGAGYFFYLNNLMTPGEWWTQIGGGIDGRVCNITPFFVEFESRDPEKGGALLQRASMMEIVTGRWQRNYRKESDEEPVTKEELHESMPTTRLKEV